MIWKYMNRKKEVIQGKDYKLCAGLYYPCGGTQAIELVDFFIEKI